MAEKINKSRKEPVEEPGSKRRRLAEQEAWRAVEQKQSAEARGASQRKLRARGARPRKSETERDYALRRILHLDETLKIIRNVNQLIVATDNEPELLHKVCQRLVRGRNFKLAWIGLVKKGSRDVLPAAQCGLPDGYLSSLKVTWDDSDYGSGPTGTAIKTGKPSVMRDIPGNPAFEPWREQALEKGCLSAAALPLIIDGEVIGAFSLYSAEPDAFDEKEVNLLTELAGDISLGIQKIRQREAMRIAEEKLRQSEEKYRGLVSNVNVGVVRATPEPGGVYLEVNPAMSEITGYSREELLQMKVADLYYHPEERKAALGKIMADSHQLVETTLKKKDGMVRMVSIRGTTVRDSRGRIRYFDAIIEDITERKQAEEALKTSVLRLKEAQQLGKIGNWEFDVATQKIEWSDEVFALYERDKALGPPSPEEEGRYYSREEAGKTREFARLAIEQGKEFGYDLKPILPSGKTVFFYATMRPIKDKSGRVVKLFGTVQDITERKKAEEELLKFKTITDEAGYGATVTDVEGVFSYVNEAFARMHGYTPEELVGEHYSILYTEEQLKVVKQIRDTSIKESSYFAAEIWRKKKDGTVFPTYNTNVIIKDNTGKPLYIATVVMDITELKQADEALRESEERYRALIELGGRSGEAMVMLEDTDKGTGMHIFASDTWAHMTGYSREELTTMPMSDLIHPRYREEAVARHRRRMRGEVLKGLYEIAIVRKDGTEFPVEATYAPSTYHGRRVNVGFIRDITERKKAEEERKNMLEQVIVNDRLASIGQLASGIAHELNNPLTGVIGFSEMLMKRTDLPDDAKEDLKIVNDEAQRTVRVVKGLLTFARRQKTEKEAVDINSLIQNVLQLRSYEHKVSNIEVNTRFAPDLPEVMGNGGQLQQVFINLIVNAEQAMLEAHNRGTLTIVTERVGDIIKASVADDGPGISPENTRKLFTPFFTTKEPVP